MTARVRLSVVPQPQFERIDSDGVSQFVHRRFECERTARFARGTHIRRRADVLADQRLRNAYVRHRVQHLRQHRTRFDEDVEDRRIRRRGMNRRQQLPVAAGTERDALFRTRTPADRAEHLWPGQNQLYGTAQGLGRHRGEDRMRPRRTLAAETAPKVRTQDANRRDRDAEHVGEPFAR